MAECGGRFELVRFVAGDLPAHRMESIRSHLSGCGPCRGEAERIRANLQAYAERQDSHLHLLRARLAQAPAPRRRALWPLLAPALAAAAALALVLVVPGRAVREEFAAEVGYKGKLVLQVFAKRGEAQFRVREDQPLKAGDVLRFLLTADSPGYLTLFSVDARGVVSPFYPSSDPASDPAPWALGQAGAHELPDGIMLDDAPGTEVVLLWYSAARFRRDQVHAQLTAWLREGKVERMQQEAARRGAVLKILRLQKDGKR